jgi:hypothetical protein
VKKFLNFLCAAIIVLLVSSPVHALVILNFENVPQDYWYFGGNQNLGNYYPGVTFGTDATILESQIYGYNDIGYPAHSGYAVLFSAINPGIRVDFATPTDHVELWYTTYYPLSMEAYNSSDDLLTSSTGGNNYYSNSFLEVNWGSADIAYVLLNSTNDFYCIDDFGYNPTVNPTPEPSTCLLFLFGLMGMVGIKKRMA